MLFNTKKDRVIHHGTYVPSTNTVCENVEAEETGSKVSPPCESIPSPIVDATPKIDVKQPDSSNGNDDIVGQTSLVQTERSSSPEKSTSPHINISSEMQDTVVAGKTATETTDVAESIQVDEISSSEILEETGESENKIVDESTVVKSVNLEDEKQPTNERNESNAEHDNVQTPIQPSAKKSEQFNKLRELLVETGISDVTPQQNTFLSTNEDIQPPTLAGNKPRRSDSVVPVEINGCDDVETRNDVVLSGPRHKHLQQPLFPATTPNVRSIKRRHSLNSQSRNAYADIAPSDPKTYVSIKSRYKVPTAKSSVAGNAANEENMLKNTSNRHINGGNAATVGNKRRHSAIAQAIDDGYGMQQQPQEPCAKRRTRSEDRPSLTDENDPANQVTEDTNSRLSWPTSDSTLSKNNGATATLPGQDRLSSSNTFQRRSLGKKATLVKTIRRPSISGSNRLQQLRGSFGLRDWDQGRNNRTGNCNDRRLNRTVALIGSTDTTIPQRWLRLVFDRYLLSPYPIDY